MGLRDILTGMQNGPRGQPQPISGGGAGGAILTVIVGLVKSMMASQQTR